MGALLFGRGMGHKRDNNADTKVSEEGEEEAHWSSHSPPAQGEMTG